MDENTLIEKIISEVDKLFPRKCSCCGKEFKSFAEFLELTTILQHAASDNFIILNRNNFFDILALRNCECQSTIAIPCAVNDEFKKELVTLITEEAKRLNSTPKKIAGILRDKIVQRVLHPKE
ncbi:MAG: hypothetical protein LDL13_04720 [Calditerrivibrio sp.]|nr:hypothetical protein [Calditerrivibrio sp.]MCA1932860.1 hypothetical protein [Calditerrivibrio sp.]